MSTKAGTGGDTPELVCVLDRELPSAERAVEALGKNMSLHADGERFPGWDTLQHCAWKALGRRSLWKYPQTLAQKIRDGNINMSILLNTSGGFVGYIKLFRLAAQHLLGGRESAVRTFAVTAYSAGADIGMIAPKNNRYVTQRGEYLWHTGQYNHADADDEKRERIREIAEIQEQLLYNVRRGQRRKMHQLLLNVLADERNKGTRPQVC